MRVLVDADACPVVRQTEEICREFHVPVTLLCASAHVLRSSYSEVRTVGTGKDAVDIALINLASPGDLVVTQDYGVAALALGKGCAAIHQSGTWYTDENIDALLAERAMGQKMRRSHGKKHMRGPKKRTAEDDKKFCESFRRLLTRQMEAETGGQK